MKARLAIVAAIVGGCTSVHVAQRNDCWVRTTDRWPNRITEEVGPCSRPQPTWSNDRLTRLVQECVAQSDYRWQNRAMAAWTAGQPTPAPEKDENVLEACVAEATKSAISENEMLEAKLAVLGDERERLRAHDDQITAALGEAAKKPAGSAVATATAEGKGDGNSSSQHESKSEESHSSEQASSAAPPMILQQPASQPVILQAPAPAPAPQPIVLSQPAPAPMPMPQPIILNSQAPQMQPIVLNAPAPQVTPIYLPAPQEPAKPQVRVVKRTPPPAPKCPPRDDQKPDVATAKAEKTEKAENSCPEPTPHETAP